MSCIAPKIRSRATLHPALHPARKIFRPHRATPSRGDWASLPAPARRDVVASVALNLTTRRERPTFAAPPRLAQPSRALSWPSQLNGALKHVVAQPLLRNALVFIALRHYVHMRLIVIRIHILNKKLACGTAWF